MSNQDIGNDVTDASQNNEQAEQAKTYTQEEFDQHMARMKASISKKYEKTYADLGDINELKQLKTEAEKRKTEEQMKRGEFEKTLQELASKKDEEIRRRDEIIRNYSVDTPLVSVAAQFGAVNAEQVKALLKPSVRLNSDGEVEIVDTKGTVRYNDSGQPLKVEDLVKEFLSSNPHFKAAGPTTTSGKSNLSQTKEKFDVTKLNMSNQADRKLYAEYRKTLGL
jgi:formate-dependent nitrite reductase cytochrome c552 subunit